MTGLVAWLASHLLWVLGVSLVTMVAVVVWVVRGLERSASSRGAEAAGAPGPIVVEPADAPESESGGAAEAVSEAFRHGLDELGRRLPDARGRYRVPWHLLIGPPRTGKTALARALEAPSGMRGEPAPSEGTPLRWFFHDEGVVLDVAGRLVWTQDGGHDARGWNRLLSLIARARPERPLDGIVVTLPAEWLGGSEPGDERSLHELGAALHARIGEIQKQLGMALPVYVVITRCDALEGFAPFAAGLPERLRRSILGWSSPHALPAGYSDQWLTDAFDAIEQQLVGLTTELLARPEGVQEPDAVFGLPHQIGRMRAAARIVIDELVRESAYVEGPVLRGIYLTGDTVASSGKMHLPGRRPRFVRDLFEAKIFPERGLGRAVSRGLIDRNRTIRLAQAAILALAFIGGPMMFWAHGRLDERSRPLVTLLDDLRSDLGRMQGRFGEPASSGAREFEGYSSDEVVALDLLRDMAWLDARVLRSIWIPSSWFSPVNGQIKGALEWGFGEVILPTLRTGVVTWADTIGSLDWARDQGGRLDRTTSSGEPSSMVAPTSLAGFGENATPERAVFEEYLRELSAYGGALNRFNLVAQRDQADIGAFVDLVSWYFEEELPEGFRENDTFYRSGLARARERPIDPAERLAFDELALDVTRGLARDVYVELSRSMGRLSTQLQGWSVDVPADLAEARARLRALQNDLYRVESLVLGSNSYWFDPSSPPSDDLLALVDSIPISPFFPEDRRDRGSTRFARNFGPAFMAARAEGIGLVQAVLPSAVSESGGGVLRAEATDGEVELSLAPWLVDLRIGLNELLEADFMRPVVEAPVEMRPAGMSRPGWNATALDGVITDLRESQLFLSQGLDRFPVRLQSAIRETVNVASAARVREGMGRAMVFEVATEAAGVQGLEAELGARISSFDAAARRLVQILEIYGARGEVDGEQAIAAVVTLEVADLLALADELLEEAQIYRLSGAGLARWSGQGSPAALDAFGVTNAEQLDEYLGRQAQFVQRVVTRYAAPLLGYLELAPVRTFIDQGGVEIGTEGVARIRRWQRVVETLDQHANQIPGNTMGALETFIRTTMVEATGPARCPGDRSAGSTDDFFSTRRAALARALSTRCVELARESVATGYDDLRLYFDRNLAGRFPFVSQTRAARAADAEFGAVRDLLRRLGRLEDDAGGAAASVLRGMPGGEDASRFVSRLQALRPVLSALAPDSSVPSPPGVEWQIDFRSRRGDELGGDQIIEWTLQVGDSVARYGDPDESRVGSWEPGRPVSFTLRWAEGSGVRPLNAPIVGLEQPEVIDGIARWRYEGPWSLLRFVAQHWPEASAGLERRETADAIDLRFQVVTGSLAPVDDFGTLESDRVTQVWSRLRFIERESRRPLVLQAFPVAAPSLGTAYAP